MLEMAVEAVRGFAIDKNIDFKSDLSQLPARNDLSPLLAMMRTAAEACDRMAHERSSDANEQVRLLRLHLIIEECAELIQGILDANRDEILDGSADLIYVVLGANIAFDLPICDAFTAVHLSNMTKAPRVGDDMRLRNKGEDYVAPALTQKDYNAST